MGTHFRQGFTIIETMLVLAITGVMVASLIVGVGGTINAQRYKDSVNSLQSTIQSQYTQVDNVTNLNDRSATYSCSLSGSSAELAPGQSDCVLMGRYISIVDDNITTAAVIGYQKSTTTVTNDITDIKTNYTLGISQNSVETATMEWGAAIAWPTRGLDAKTGVSGRSIAILILRSPQSGLSYTFTGDTVNDVSATTNANLQAMVVVGNTVPGQAQRFLCVDPSPGSTGLTVPEKLSVTIDQAASATTGIELRSDTVNKNMNQESSCNS